MERGGGAYEVPLGDRLSPLTTETSTLTGASGNFCPSQKTAGAFLVTGVQCVKETGPLPATWPTACRTVPSSCPRSASRRPTPDNGSLERIACPKALLPPRRRECG